MIIGMKLWCVACLALILGGCGLLSSDLPDQAPPLADLEEPLTLQEEPDDEAVRRSLSPGTFTGLYVEDMAESLEAMDDEDEGGGGVLVSRVVENSPAEIAGLEEGDILVEVTVNSDTEPTLLDWASTWREVELEATAGDRFRLLYDRAGIEKEAMLTTLKRVKAPERGTAVRLREEERVGVIVRTATEVEARRAELGPGGGAVVVGLSARSPWRKAGVQFEDIIVTIDGQPVAHPQVVLNAIRGGNEDQSLSLGIMRGGEMVALSAPLADRESELTGFSIPLLFDHESERGTSDTSLLMGLLGYKETRAAWEFRLLWFITMTGGDADKLEEVEVDS